MTDIITLTENERKALKAWVGTYEDFDYLSFTTTSSRSGLDHPLVRRTVRSMARKGVTQFCSGLANEEGKLTGSGYGLTATGRDLMHHIYKDEIDEAFA